MALSCGPALPDPGRGDRASSGVATMRVTITAGDRGVPERPRSFAVTHEFTLRVEALGEGGAPVTGFNGTAMLSVSPGVLTGISGPGVSGRLVRLNSGVADGVVVRFQRAYGEARIYA